MTRHNWSRIAQALAVALMFGAASTVIAQVGPAGAGPGANAGSAGGRAPSAGGGTIGGAADRGNANTGAANRGNAAINNPARGAGTGSGTPARSGLGGGTVNPGSSSTPRLETPPSRVITPGIGNRSSLAPSNPVIRPGGNAGDRPSTPSAAGTQSRNAEIRPVQPRSTPTLRPERPRVDSEQSRDGTRHNLPGAPGAGSQPRGSGGGALGAGSASPGAVQGTTTEPLNAARQSGTAREVDDVGPRSVETRRPTSEGLPVGSDRTSSDRPGADRPGAADRSAGPSRPTLDRTDRTTRPSDVNRNPLRGDVAGGEGVRITPRPETQANPVPGESTVGGSSAETTPGAGVPAGDDLSTTDAARDRNQLLNVAAQPERNNDRGNREGNRGNRDAAPRGGADRPMLTPRNERGNSDRGNRDNAPAAGNNAGNRGAANREDRPGRNADQPGRNADQPARNADRPGRSPLRDAPRPGDDTPRTNAPGRENADRPGTRNNTDRPSLGNADRPGRGNADRPGNDNRPGNNRPGDADANRPGRGNTDRPDSGNVDRPGTNNADRPGTGNADRPNLGNDANPAREKMDRPGRDNADRPGRDNNDRPNRDNADRPNRGNADRPANDAGDRPDPAPMPDASAAGKNADRPAGRDGEGRVGRNNRDNAGNNRAGRDRIDAEARERLTALRGNRQSARSAEDVNRALESNKVLPVAIGRNGQLSNLDTKIDLTKIRNRDQLRDIKDQRDLARALGLRDNDSLRAFNTLNVDRLPGRFQNRLGDRDIDRLVPRFGRANDLRLARQYDLYRRGDVARQLNLFGNIRGDRGWRNRIYGPVAGIYTGAAFSYWYAGPSFYPSYVWYPAWQPWVSWSWWDTVPVVYDPRPIYVQPIYTVEPAPVWNVATYADYPDFVSLPAVPAGTWVDVEPAIVEEGTDVQLLAVRFVDPGHPDEGTGPRFRVWVRNNTKSEISTAFDITVVASAEDEPTTEAPQAGVRLGTLEPEQVAAVDIRLPAEANTLVQDEEGRRVPFNKLHVIVDSHRELKDVNLENNGAVITRSDVLPVDPAAFALDYTAVAPESMVSLAGEGLGPEPGQVILVVDGQEYEPEIYGWYDLGVYFQIPADVKVQDAVEAEVLIVRGDGAATNPLALQIAPSDDVGPVIGTLPDAPEPDRE